MCTTKQRNRLASAMKLSFFLTGKKDHRFTLKTKEPHIQINQSINQIKRSRGKIQCAIMFLSYHFAVAMEQVQLENPLKCGMTEFENHW